MNDKVVFISELISRLSSADKKDALESVGIHCDSKEMEAAICKSLESRLSFILNKYGDIDCKEIMP